MDIITPPPSELRLNEHLQWFLVHILRFLPQFAQMSSSQIKELLMCIQTYSIIYLKECSAPLLNFRSFLLLYIYFFCKRFMNEGSFVSKFIDIEWRGEPMHFMVLISNGISEYDAL